jgi:hypothetical protein
VLARTGRRAKMRTGGVTAASVPSPEAVVRFMSACINAGVPFKATAGLHHAIGGRYALTYEADSAHATMYGYLNLFAAAALLVGHASAEDAVHVLTGSDASQVHFTDRAMTWGETSIDRTRLAHLREHVAISFGSCSFAEPVAESRALGMW